MLLKILLLSIVTGAVTMNAPINIDKTIKYDEVVTTESIKQRNYQHSDWLSSYTEVVYKYDTNEVNTIDDYVVGNSYLLEFSCYFDTTGSDNSIVLLYDNRGQFTLDEIYFENNSLYYYLKSDLPFDFCRVFTNSTSLITRMDGYQVNDSLFTINGQSNGTFTFHFVITFLDLDNKQTWFNTAEVLNYIKTLPNEYNVVESVIYHQPTTIIGYLNEFLETNLLNEIPFIRDINFEIGGQNINLMTWVIMAFGFILIGMLFYFLIRLIIWLVKLFSNSFLLR